LPPVQVETPWWPDVEPVVRAVRERDGIEWSDKPLDWIKPRNLGSLPRCPYCKSESPVRGAYQPAPMFHLATRMDLAWSAPTAWCVGVA